MKVRKPSPALVIAIIALVITMTGTAAATNALTGNEVQTSNIANGAVTNIKLGNGSVGFKKLNSPIRGALDYLNRARANGTLGGPKGDKGDTGPAGPKGDTGPAGPKGADGTNGTNGTNGKDGAAILESTRLCTPDLCVDDAPGPGGASGSGGFGYDPTTDNSLTNLTIGTTYPLTVTVIQDGTTQADGSITLTWNPHDFTGPSGTTDANGDGTCTTASTGNAFTCTYTDLAHQNSSKAFDFTPLNANPGAIVSSTVQTNGEQASAQFPVAIAAN